MIPFFLFWISGSQLLCFSLLLCFSAFPCWPASAFLRFPVFLQKNKAASKEIADMRKQGTHMAKASTKCGNDLDQMSREFWAWLSKALRSELSNTVSGVLEQAAALLGCEQASVEEFSIKDMENVLKCSEVVNHSIWDGLSAELAKEKKILKLFEFYNKLAEHATDLIKFALSVSPRTQSLFQGAALPPKPPPEALLI